MSSTPTEQTSGLMAIDVLLEPDEAMARKAKAANDLMLSNYAGGFAFDASHVPHLTLLQRFVRAADLDQISEAIGRVVAGTEVGAMELTVVRYSFVPGGETAAAAMAVEPTPELRRLHEDLVRAVAPYARAGGTAAAFVRTAAEPEIGEPTIAYVEKFVTDSGGEKFNPHLTVGIAQCDFLDGLRAEPFETLTFRPVSLSIYQLGNLGTARRLLKKYK